MQNAMQKTMKVDPRVLEFSPWNVNSVPEANQRKLEESIRRNGIFRPVVVRELECGALQVIAGEHTTRASIALDYQEIDVYNLGPISELQAKEISVIDNQHYGNEDAFELTALLKEFDGNVEEFMPFSDDDLKSLFKSSTIDFDSLEIPEASDIPASPGSASDDLAGAPVTHQFMRFKVPIGDAEFVARTIEGIAKHQGFTSGDSLTNVGDALVYICNQWNQS